MMESFQEWLDSVLSGDETRSWDWNDILYEIESPREFEELVANVWEEAGYDTQVTQRTRDGGYDIKARKSSIIGGPEVVVIEVKHYQDTAVTRPEVQQLEGVRSGENADLGVFVTSSRFNDTARTWVEKNTQIEPINGKELVERLNQTNIESPNSEYH